MVGIPKDITNIDPSLQFLNYLTEPEVIVDVTNYVAYANPNVKSTALQDQDLSNNPSHYPPAKVKKTPFHTEATQS